MKRKLSYKKPELKIHGSLNKITKECNGDPSKDPGSRDSNNCYYPSF